MKKLTAHSIDSIVMTRQMYCERCAKNNHPTRDQQFLVHGQKGFHIRTVKRYVEKDNKGFTPHLVAFYKGVNNTHISFSRVCGIVGCGLTIGKDPEGKNKMIFTYKRVSYEQMSVKDWNCLVLNKDLGYFLD